MDAKINTFITLCETLNYRAASEILHITQPAVTKQIQSLEQEYNVKLFNYDGRKLSITEKGQIFLDYSRSLMNNYKELENVMKQEDIRELRVGVTKTIGEYVIGEWVAKYLKESKRKLKLVVDNTDSLVNMLNDNMLDFILVEGMFCKERYDYRLFREEKYTGICNSSHPFAGKRITVDRLKQERLIVREEGSGTRKFFQGELEESGYSLEIFDNLVTVSSFEVIRELIKENIGITFGYKSITKDEKEFSYFMVDGWRDKHEFNIVYLKHTNAGKLVDEFFIKN